MTIPPPAPPLPMTSATPPAPSMRATGHAATQVTNEPAPTAGGTSQSLVIDNLTQNTTYYFAIKTSDEVPNTSGLSNVASGQTLADTTAPGAVTSLTVTKTKSSTLRLAWIASGDDGADAHGHQLRRPLSHRRGGHRGQLGVLHPGDRRTGRGAARLPPQHVDHAACRPAPPTTSASRPSTRCPMPRRSPRRPRRRRRPRT